MFLHYYSLFSLNAEQRMKQQRGTRANLLTNQLTSQGARRGSDRPENQDQCFRVERDWEGGDWSGRNPNVQPGVRRLWHHSRLHGFIICRPEEKNEHSVMSHCSGLWWLSSDRHTDTVHVTPPWTGWTGVLGGPSHSQTCFEHLLNIFFPYLSSSSHLPQKILYVPTL